MVVEESREIVVVLDEEERVIGASRRARESLPGLEEGRPLPGGLVGAARGTVPLSIPYEVDGRRETRRDRTVDVFVRRLRTKVDRRAPRHTFIQTRYGVGYKLEAVPKS